MPDLAQVQRRIAKLHDARLLDALTEADERELAELYELERAAGVVDLRENDHRHSRADA